MMVRKVFAVGLVSALTALANAQIVTNLEQGGKIFWKFNSGRYAISGAISDAGNVTASDPVELTLRDLNNDGRKLDVLLDLGELGLDIDYVLPLVGSVVSQDANEAIIEWYANVTPNQCVTVNIGGAQVQVLVTRLEGKLRGRVTPIPCQTNPYNPNWQKVTLRFDENGGNENNFLYVEGYVLCLQIPQTFATAIINNMDWDAYGGGFTGVFGNVNGDNIVDDADLLQVLFDFGTNNPASDTNEDGIVDDADLLTVLFNFGTSC